MQRLQGADPCHSLGHIGRFFVDESFKIIAHALVKFLIDFVMLPLAEPVYSIWSCDAPIAQEDLWKLTSDGKK